MAANTQEHAAPLLSQVAAGVVGGLLTVVICSSCAALIFTGALSAHVSVGIGMALLCSCVCGFTSAMASSYPGTISNVQTEPAALMAVMVPTVVAALPSDAPPDLVLGTVVAAIVCSTLLTGVFLFALGSLRLGALARFIPYPVIGGFMAGIGWLLVTGSIALMTDIPAGLSQVAQLLRPDMCARWGSGLLLAVAILVARRRTDHALVMPAILAISTLCFYVVLLATDTSIAEATAQGWLLGTASGGHFGLTTALVVLDADWWTVLGQGNILGAIALISLISLLLNASALEISSEHDIDLDQELRTTGVANLVAGLGGGMVGYHSLSVSTLVLSMRAQSRLTGLIVVATCALTLVAGTSVLALFPKPVLGGLLMFLGLSFLVNWVYDARARLPRSDYLVVLLILVTVGTVGYLEGVAIGIVAAAILFTVNYSRINLIKQELSGALHHSNVDRPPTHRQILRDHGDETFALKLQGYIFFGSANGLLNRVRTRIASAKDAPLRFLILDFSRVTGLDTSAAISFVKLQQLARRGGFAVLYSSVPPELRPLLPGVEHTPPGTARIPCYPDLDHALEQCEDALLVTVTEATPPPSDGHWRDALPGPLADHLLPYLQRIEIAVGERLIQQGVLADDLFFIESGQLSVVLESDRPSAIRVRKIGPGAVLGELGLYLRSPRSASVIADRPSVVYRLEGATLARLQHEAPEHASAFHEYMARLLAERLVHTNRILEAVLD
jgi:SulP family sulfate permease